MAPPRTFISLGDPVMDVIAHVDALPSSIPEPGGCLPVNGTEMERLLSALPPSKRRSPGGSASNVARGVAELLKRLSGDSSSPPSRGLPPPPPPPPRAIEVEFIGMAGDDETAREYESALAERGVAPRLLRAQAEEGEGENGGNDGGSLPPPPRLPTATCLCLVTPGGERTMRTSLGAASLLRRAEQLPRGWCAGAVAVHVEGYALWREGLAAGAMKAARRQRRREEGEADGASSPSPPSPSSPSPAVITSIDCASFEVVRARREELEALLGTGDVDIMFCNEEEAAALAEGEEEREGNEGEDSEEERKNVVVFRALRRALDLGARVAVASMGAAGARAMAKGGGGKKKGEKEEEEDEEEDKPSNSYSSYSCPAVAVESVADTVGAGDAFTAGFLASLLLSSSEGNDERQQRRGGQLRETGGNGGGEGGQLIFRGEAIEAALRLGCAAGAATVRAAGADPGKEAWDFVAAKVFEEKKEKEKKEEKYKELALA